MSHTSDQSVADSLFARNKWMFGLGTFGRDMVYTLIAMFLIVFLTEVADLSDSILWWVSILMLGTRLVDAGLDLVMGTIVDNTNTKWGQYKPWIAAGAIASGAFTLALFVGDQTSGAAYVTIFFLLYLGWSLTWTMNDIPYWALLPALTLDQKKREQAASIAKTTASIGMFGVVVAIIPATNALAEATGSARTGWLIFVGGVVAIMWAFQAITLFGVRQPSLTRPQERTSARGLLRAVSGNDQLLWVALSMVLFMTGFVTTTSFGPYFFKYAYGDENMYSPFAAVLAVAQLAGYSLFPVFSKRYSRRTLYSAATALMLAGYLIFMFSPMNMIPIGVAGLLMFFADAWIVLLMLVFLTDTIEYGHWKLGKRNTALTFAVQPFINKVGGALGTQVVAMTVIWTGINTAETAADVSSSGIWAMKATMLILPPTLILIGYIIYRAKYRIGPEVYAQMVADLRERGELE